MNAAPCFIDDLSITKVAENPKPIFRLNHQFRFRSKIYQGIINVPEGFPTDFASVPRLPLAYLAAGGCGDEAAVIHDFLFSTHLVGFMVANKIFLEAMKCMGVSLWRRNVMFGFVCAFGWILYLKGPDKLEKIKKAPQTN